MKNLSKIEKLRLEKQRERKVKKIKFYSFLILVLSIGSYLIINSAIHTEKFNIPFVGSSDVPNEGIHWHQKLEINFNGDNFVIPNDIGLSPGIHSSTHTHDEGDGTIHLENNNPQNTPETMSLGYFFYLWKEPFNQTSILDKNTNVDGGEIHMYVNGVENFVFAGEDIIVINYTK